MTVVETFLLFFAFILLSCVLVISVHSSVRVRRFAILSENDLLERLHLVPLEAITTLALEHLNSSGEHAGPDPLTIWRMLGGSRGLRRMTDNGEIMIAIAAYMERWNPTELQFEVARMRRDGVLLRRAAGRLSRRLSRQIQWIFLSTPTKRPAPITS